MPRLCAPVLLLVSFAIAIGCAKGRFGPSASTPISPAPRDIDSLTVDERRAIMRRAQVWRPIDTASLNLLTGPDAPDALPFDSQVTCTYHYPDSRLSGVTPKFECELKPGDVVKVKYGNDNGEVFAEVAGSRLFWALGFIVDRMYPVKVLCKNCPQDPFRESKAEWRLGKSANGSDKLFDPAAIERKMPGEEIEVPDYEGWAWPELAVVDESAGGAPRAHVDALKLLAVFVQHVDNKPDQQAIICQPEGVGRDGEGNATCSAPYLMIKDLGSTFGGAKKFNYDKFKFDSWREVPIWKDRATCTGDLTRSLIGNLRHPRISEAGRKFLADRLMLLSDAQIRDLFIAARADRRGEKTMDATGGTRPVKIDDWVRAFKEKRTQIVEHRCLTT